MTTVQLQKIDQSFGAVPVLRGLDLRAESGQYLVLLGESGGGKTTTLRIIAGLQKPNGGTVLLGGTDVGATPPRSRDVAMVFQHDALYPHLTVAGSIRLPLKNRVGREEVEQRVRAAAEMTGIGSLLERSPHQLSGGQLRRAAIAKAIARQSGVRLLDEPLASLDGQARESLQEDIVRWHRSLGGTTIHVTHDGQEAMRMADVIAVLSDGKIEQCDTPSNIFRHPASLAVARAVGSPTIQCFEALIEDGRSAMVNHADAKCRFAVNDIRGDAVIGVRPESFHVETKEGTTKGIWIPGIVQRCSQVQRELYVEVQCENQTVLAVRSIDESVTAGDRVWLYAEQSELHVFPR